MGDQTSLSRGRFRKFVVSVGFEKLRRLFRTLFRPLVNTTLSIRYRCLIHPLARVDRGVRIGAGTMIGNCILDTMGGRATIEIGTNTIVYDRCEILAQVGTTVRIGSCVLFTRHAAIVTGGHTIEGADTPIMEKGIKVGDVTIGDDCWIGYGALVLMNVTVGSGSVVAARSVVTRDVEPYSVVGGVPSRFIRRRE